MLSDVCVLKAPRNWYLEKFKVSCYPVACLISFQHSILGIKTLKQFISRYIISLFSFFNSALKKALSFWKFVIKSEGIRSYWEIFSLTSKKVWINNTASYVLGRLFSLDLAKVFRTWNFEIIRFLLHPIIFFSMHLLEGRCDLNFFFKTLSRAFAFQVWRWLLLFKPRKKFICPALFCVFFLMLILGGALKTTTSKFFICHVIIKKVSSTLFTSVFSKALRASTFVNKLYLCFFIVWFFTLATSKGVATGYQTFFIPQHFVHDISPYFPLQWAYCVEEISGQS